jgi:xylose isomerase
MTRPLYAVRLNAFRAGMPRGATTADLIARAATVPGIGAADLNFPDHLNGHRPGDLARCLSDHGLALNGLALRWGSDPAFALGAFTHPDGQIRTRAVDLCRRALDALAEMGGGVLTLWQGQDGVDYALQADHLAQWDHAVAALAAVADHAPAVPVAVEYKPDEPRAKAHWPDAATALLAVRDAGRPNLGVALDFAHSLYAGEIPARSALLIARHARLLGVHLNDGYGRRDDGLMVGSVHPVETVELFLALGRIGYRGPLYFDTFPDHGGLDPVAEAAANVAMTDRLWAAAGRLAADPALSAAQERQDAAAVMAAVQAALYR